MITVPSEQPEGTRFWVTRRPDVFIEWGPPCEEILAGPFASFDEAARMRPTVRGWMQSLGLALEANAPMGVLAIRPTCTLEQPVQPRFERVNGECQINEAPTRLTAQWILQHAAERRESLGGYVAPGFRPSDHG